MRLKSETASFPERKGADSSRQLCQPPTPPVAQGTNSGGWAATSGHVRVPGEAQQGSAQEAVRRPRWATQVPSLRPFNPSPRSHGRGLGTASSRHHSATGEV